MGRRRSNAYDFNQNFSFQQVCHFPDMVDQYRSKALREAREKMVSIVTQPMYLDLLKDEPAIVYELDTTVGNGLVEGKSIFDTLQMSPTPSHYFC